MTDYLEALLEHTDVLLEQVRRLERQERFRYMGPAEHPLHPDMVVEWKGQAYRVQSAHLMGEDICPHWWAMLSPRDEEAL